MLIQSWTDVIVASFQNAWATIINFIPALVGALIILIVGLLVATGLRTLFDRIIGLLRIDSLLGKLGLRPIVERAGFQLNSGKFIGALIYWFFVVVTVLAASDVLGLWGLSGFLTEVLTYLPNIIVAILIMLAALVVANFLRGLVKASVLGAKLHSSKFLGTLTWWVVVIFGLLAALIQLGIATQLIQTVIIGIIAMFALAGGIAFGLGGRDYASHLIERFRDNTENR